MNIASYFVLQIWNFCNWVKIRVGT